jgi:septal ring factor EnvC (AmiA/AmiB activator)
LNGATNPHRLSENGVIGCRLLTIGLLQLAMSSETDNLVLEQLRAMRASLEQIKTTLADHTHQFIRIREDVHSLRGDVLRHDEHYARLEVRLEKIEKRLGLIDA